MRFQGTARIVQNLAGPKNANAARKNQREMPRFQGTAHIVWNLASPKNTNAAHRSKQKSGFSQEPYALFGTSQVLKMLMQPVKAKKKAAFLRNRKHCLEPFRF